MGSPALGLELVDDPEPTEPPESPEELSAVLDIPGHSYAGVREAIEEDGRGRSRKMVQQYANREDLSSDEVDNSPEITHNEL